MLFYKKNFTNELYFTNKKDVKSKLKIKLKKRNPTDKQNKQKVI